MRLLPLLVVAAMVSLAAQQPARDPARRTASGAAIVRGVVVDEPTGTPIAGARVSLSLRATGDSPFESPFAVQATTGADGRFEFTGVPAGAFVLSGGPGEFRGSHRHVIFGHEGEGPFLGGASFDLSSGEIKEDLQLALPRALAIEGRVVDEYGEPMADLSVTAKSVKNGLPGAQQQSDDRGWFRLHGLAAGTYQVCAAPDGWNGMMASSGQGLDAKYPSTCAVEAVTVTGRDTPLVTVAMRRSGAYTVAGTVVSSTGLNPSEAHVSFQRIDLREGSHSVPVEMKDGRFVARGVLPGTYVVAASFAPRGADPFLPHERGVVDLTVAGDVTGVTVTTVAAAAIAGRVVRDPNAMGPLAASMAIRLMAPFDRMRFAMSPQPTAPVRPDGTFEVTGLFGPLTILVERLPRGWVVQRVRHGDDEITGQAREFKAGDSRPVEIIVTDRSGSLLARPVDAEGRAVKGAQVILLAADPRRRHGPTHPGNSRVDADGYVELGPAAPGDYFAVALPGEDLLIMWRTLPSLDAIASFGRRVTIAEGPPQKIDVPVRSLGGAR